MDDTILPSTTFCCRSDKNVFGELHGHFEIQNGQFQAENRHFRPFWHLSHRKVIKNIIKWMIPYSLVQLFFVIQIKIFLESSMAIFRPFLHLRERKVIKNKEKWTIPQQNFLLSFRYKYFRRAPQPFSGKKQPFQAFLTCETQEIGAYFQKEWLPYNYFLSFR